MLFGIPKSTPNNQNSQPDIENQGNLQNRKVVRIPAASSDFVRDGAAPFCCLIGAACVIAGAVMWGVCADPTEKGCSQAVLKSGKVLVYAGSCILVCLCFLGIAEGL